MGWMMREHVLGPNDVVLARINAQESYSSSRDAFKNFGRYGPADLRPGLNALVL